MSWKEHLNNIYFDLKSPISYAGPTKIYKYLRQEGKYKVGLHAIRKWLQDIDAYSLQRPLRHNFKMRRVIAQGRDALWDVDLADVSNLAKYNDGTRYLLVAIDVFSRYLSVETCRINITNQSSKVCKIYSRWVEFQMKFGQIKEVNGK